MDLNSLPTEILGIILGHLIEPIDPEWEPEKFKIEPIRQARFVCRKWNTLASAHLFGTVHLVHHGMDPAELGSRLHLMPNPAFWHWDQMIDKIPLVRQTARCAVIYSCPDELDQDSDFASWYEWILRGRYPEYLNAIKRIADLPNLNAIEVRFSRHWLESGSEQMLPDIIEPSQARERTCKAVFQAIKDRAQTAGPGVTQIRSLTMDNLHTRPMWGSEPKALFAEVLGSMTQVHFNFCELFDRFDGSIDMLHKERWKFEPHLQKELLPLLSEQLTTLTLYFTEYWGTLPGYFSGEGLSFPNLTTLTLGHFVVGHNEHLDWVTRQKNLKSLRLDRCFIVSHLNVDSKHLVRWGAATHGWVPHPAGSFGFRTPILARSIFTFNLTWASLFDKIRTGLPRLSDFRFDATPYRTRFSNTNRLGARLRVGRYIVFNEDMTPSPWIEPDFDTGEMDFGNGILEAPRLNNNPPKRTALKEINRGRDTAAGDRRAFEALVEATRGRR